MTSGPGPVIIGVDAGATAVQVAASAVVDAAPDPAAMHGLTGPVETA